MEVGKNRRTLVNLRSLSSRLRGASSAVLCRVALLGLPALGCGATFGVVQLDPEDYAAHGKTATGLCYDSKDEPRQKLYEHKLQPDPVPEPPKEMAAGPAHFRRYLLGPDREPRLGPAYEPLFISGGVLIGVGAAGTLLSLASFLGCSASEDCNEAIPIGTAIASLGLAVVGGVFMGIGGSGDRRSSYGIARICDEPPAPPPATPAP